jgi:hypothetical protein
MSSWAGPGVYKFETLLISRGSSRLTQGDKLHNGTMLPGSPSALDEALECVTAGHADTELTCFWGELPPRVTEVSPC